MPFSVNQVKCSPVVKYLGEGDQRQRVKLSDKYVVEISVKSAPRMFYSCGDMDCYYRYGAKTIYLTPEVTCAGLLKKSMS